MRLPYPHWLTRQLDGPQVDVTITRGRQLLVILPRYVDDRTRLVETHEGLLLDHVGFPNQDRGVFASRSDQRVRFVPARNDQGVLSAEQALKLSLHTPDPGDVVISTS